MEIKANRLNKVTNEDIINGIFIFPQYITEIGYECFSGVDDLREIIIPPKITHVFDNAFMNCKNLNFCEFQNPYTILENGTFHGCLHLNNVELPTKLKTISCRL